MNIKHTIAAVSAAALIIPAGAIAKKPEDAGSKGKTRSAEVRAERGAETRGKGRAKPKTYVFKGTLAAVTADSVDVAVVKGNKRAREFAGQTVTFSLATAKVVTQDTNGDGKRDATDIATGAPVKVQARLVRDAAQPFAARKLVALEQDEDTTDQD